MKIAHVITTFYDTNAAGWVTALAVDQLARGCEVHLVVGRNASRELLERRQTLGMKVHQLQTLRKYIHPWEEIRAFWDLYRLFRAEGFDLVHTHLAKAGVLGRLAAFAAGVPRVVHTVYGATFAPTQDFCRRVLFSRLEALAARVSDSLIFVGHELQGAYRAAGVCPPGRSRVIYYGKDLSPFFALAGLSRQERLRRRRELGLGEEDLILGNVSRLVPWKGLHFGVELVARLKERFPRLKLVIVGDAKTPSEQGYRNRLRETVRRRHLTGRVVFTGWVADPAPYFAVFDLYLLTSLPFEGVPGSVLEAAAAGVPVVGFDCCGVREIPGVDATLVPPGDLEALEAVLTARLARLCHPDAASRGPSRGKMLPEVEEQLRQQFDLRRMVRETWEAYQILGG